jgi:hypothetical protein
MKSVANALFFRFPFTSRGRHTEPTTSDVVYPKWTTNDSVSFLFFFTKKKKLEGGSSSAIFYTRAYIDPLGSFNCIGVVRADVSFSTGRLDIAT